MPSGSPAVDKETDTQRGEVTFPRSHDRLVAEQAQNLQTWSLDSWSRTQLSQEMFLEWVSFVVPFWSSVSPSAHLRPDGQHRCSEAASLLPTRNTSEKSENLALGQGSVNLSYSGLPPSE